MACVRAEGQGRSLGEQLVTSEAVGSGHTPSCPQGPQGRCEGTGTGRRT